MSQTNKISWATAKQMMLDYTSSTNTNTLEATPSSLGILKGYNIELSTITGIMNYTSPSGTSPSKIGAFFGVKSEDSSVTLILVGLDSSGNIMTESAYDYSIPCPANCPSNYPTT